MLIAKMILSGSLSGLPDNLKFKTLLRLQTQPGLKESQEEFKDLVVRVLNYQTESLVRA